MKTLKKSNLEELAKIMPVLSEEIQRICIGGVAGDSGDIPPSPTGSTDGGWTPPPPVQSPLGSIDNPYSLSDAEALMNAGHWRGGYVSGMGYMLPQVESTAPSVNKPPIPGFPNFGIQTPSTSGVTGYNPGDSGYTGSNGYGGPTGSPFGTGGGGSGGSGGSGDGGDGGSSSNGYYDSSMTGSTCLPDNENSNLFYNDTMSALTGVAPGSTNKEIWEQTKYFYFKEAKKLGVDLYKRKIDVQTGRAAYAWINNNQEILLGDNFFKMYMFDCVAVLIHESIHVDRRDNEKLVSETNVEKFLLSNDPPEFVKEYARTQIEKDKEFNITVSSADMERYWDCDTLKTPVYYENEIATYTKEIQIVPDSYVSPEYSLERKYKLWKYELLLEASRAYYK